MGYCLLALSLRHLLRHTYPVTELRGDSQWGRRGLNSAKLSLCLVASNNTSDNDSRKPRRLHLFISRANQSTHKFGWHWEMGAQPLTCPGYIWMAFFCKVILSLSYHTHYFYLYLKIISTALNKFLYNSTDLFETALVNFEACNKLSSLHTQPCQLKTPDDPRPKMVCHADGWLSIPPVMCCCCCCCCDTRS